MQPFWRGRALFVVAVFFLATGALAQVDMSVTLSDSPDPVTVGTDDVVYTAFITNNSSGVTATNPTLTLTYPPSSSVQGATANSGGTCSVAGGTVTCTWAAFSGFANRTATIATSTNAGGSLSATATVSATQTDPNPGNNSATVTTTVNSTIDLRLLTLFDTPDPITLGTGDVTYSATLYNQSTSKATNPVMTVTLPAASTFVSASANLSGTCTAPSGGVLTCSWAGDLTSGATRTATIVVTPTAGGTMTLTAAASGDQADSDSSNNSASAGTTVNANIDMRLLTLNDTPDPITLGTGDVTYSATLYNQSSSKATNPVMTITLPAASTFVSASANISGTCTAPTGGVLTCNWAGDLTSGATRTVTIVVTPTAGGTMTLTAHADADQPDGDTGNNTLAQATTVNANIDMRLLSVNDTPDPITLGTGDVTYSATLYNQSTSKATNAVMTVTLPATATFVSATAANGGTCTAPSGGVLTCTWAGDLTAGATRSATVVVTPTVGGTMTLTFAASSDQPDGDSGNNSLAQATAVNANIDMRVLSVNDTPDPITLGTGDVTYSATIYNQSTSKATNAVMTVTLPATATFVSATAASAGTCTAPSGGVLTCNWAGDLTAGATRSATIIVTPTVGGTMTLTVAASSDQPDGDSGNNTLSQATTVNANIDMRLLSLSDSPDPVTLGTGDVTYSATIYNQSTSKATNAVLTVTLPATATFVSATAASAGTCTAPSGGVLTCTWAGDLTAGATRSATIIVTPTVGGTMTLTAAASSDQPDGDSGNNSLSQATAVNANIDLRLLSLSDSPDPITLGTGNITYSATLYNQSTSKATNAVMTITLPASSTLVSATANSSGTCTAPAGGVLTCNWAGDLTSGATRTATIIVTPTAGGSLTLTATASGDQPDNDTSNNSQSQSTTVNSSIELTFTVSDTPDPRVLGAGNVTYNLVVFNGTSSKATNPAVTFTIPATATYGSASPSSGGTCTQNAGVVSCNWADISASATRTVAVIVTPTVVGQMSATGSVTSDQPDPNTANNSETETTNVNPSTTPTVSGFSPVSGPVGTVVTISGSSFFSTSSVKFNGTGAAFTTVNNSSITATVPAGATTGVVTVTNAAGSTNSAASFTVTPAPDLTITKTASAASVPTGGPYSYTLAVNNGGAGSANDVTVTDVLPGDVTFSSASGTNWTCSGTTTVTCTHGALAPGAAPPITINVTAPASGTTVSNTATVSTTTPESSTANNSGSVAVSIVGCPGTPPITAPPTVCASSTGHTASVPAVPSATYFWTATNGTITGGATSNVITFDASGSGPVTLNVSVSVTSCPTAMNSVAIPVSTPTASITPSGPTTFCSGGSVTLTANAGSSYLWSTGATTPSIVVTANDTVTVTVTDAAGCSATSAPVNVVVNPTPVATITTSGPTNFCSGGSVTLTAPAGMSSYAWSNGESTPSIVVTTGGNYFVTVTNASGCSATSAPATVNVDPTPSAAITASGPTSFCSGGSVTLSAPAGMASYAWSTGETTPSIVVSADDTITVTVTNGGCSATSSPVSIVVTPAPTATITPSGPTTFCNGGSVTLTAPAGMSSYNWSNGETSPSIVVTTGGSYFVTITNASGCSATSPNTNVTVDPPPSAAITPSGPTTFCTGGSVTLTAPAGMSSYLWSTGETSPSIVVSDDATITVTVTNAGGCSATSPPVNVVANSAPVATITPSGPTTFCSGGSVTLTAPAGMSGYNWSNGQSTPSIVVTTSGNYSVTVTNGGCSATSAATTVTVDPAPAATIIASGPTTFCNGGSVTLTAPAGMSSYAWTTGETSPSIVVTTSGNYAVTVTSDGCSATSAPTAVTVTAGPAASISGPTTVCPSSTFTLSAPAGFTSYLWSNGAGTPSINVSQTEESKTWSLTVTNASGCTTTVSHVVNLGQEPVASITAPASAPHDTDLDASVPGQPGATIEWGIVNGTILTGQGSSSITFRTGAGGTATVLSVEVSANGCSAQNEQTIVLTTDPGCVPHAAPQLTSPASGATASSPVTFTWTAVAGVTDYRLFVDANGTGAQVAGETSGTTLTVALPGGSLVAFVEARFAGCPSTLSPEVPFSIPVAEPCASRAQAVPIAPANDATVNSSSVELRWASVPNASGYRVYAGIDGAAPSLLGETTETALRATLTRGEVRWFVESLFDGCASTQSALLRFVIPAATSCGTARPETISPANGTTVNNANVTFHWAPVSGAIAYELWLTLGDGSPALVGTSTETSLTRVVPEGRLQWFVRALVDRCPSRDSQTARFTYEAPFACESHQRPIAIEPLNGADAVTRTAFSWTTPEGATSYQLFVRRGNAAPELVATTSVPRAENVQLANGNLRWFVRAHFVAGCPALDSAEQELHVVPLPAPCSPLEAPVVSMPGQISSGVPFLIQWTRVPGTSSYALQLASEPAFANAVTIDTGSSAQHLLSRTNDGASPVALFARVQGFDPRCAGAQTPWSEPVAVFILPAQAQEATLPLTTGGTVTFPLPLGPELAGSTFHAVAKQPWLTVAPSSGVVPAEGITLTITADTHGLGVGTSLGAVAVTLTSPATGNVGAHGTTVVIPTFPLSLVTPVMPAAKNTPPPDALIIPAVAHANGINSQFQSDVRVSNTSPRPMQYDLTFTPSGEHGAADAKQTAFSIEAGQTIALDDILRSWFGTGSASVTGTLEIRPQAQLQQAASHAIFEGLANLSTFASSRTFNLTPRGTFGQYIPAVPFAKFAGSDSTLSLQQIAQSSRYRTNLGIVEGSGEPASLLLRVFGESGQQLTSFNLDLSGGQHLQLNSFLSQHGISSLSDGRVEIDVLSSTGKITAYASVLDNETSDPLLVTPVTLTQVGNTKWVMPGVADLDNGTANWQTDMRVFNAGTEDVQATLSFHSQNGGEAKTAQVTIPAGQVRQFDRTLASVFGVANDGGAVHIETASATRLITTARTYNQTSGGTYGQFISAVTSADATGVDSRPLQLLQVEESSRFRSNVGIAEVSGNPVTLEISVVPPDSKFTAVTQLTLGANEFRQFGSLLRSVGLDETFNARVTVKVLEGTGRVAAYASVIDQETNDPTYVPAQ